MTYLFGLSVIWFYGIAPFLMVSGLRYYNSLKTNKFLGSQSEFKIMITNNSFYYLFGNV